MPVFPAHCCLAAGHGYRTREKEQHIPLEKHHRYPGHILARQSIQSWCPDSCLKIVASLKTSSTVSWLWAGEHIRRLSTSTLCPRVELQLTAQLGGSALELHSKTGEDKLVTAAADKRARSNSTRPVTSLGCDF